MATPDDLKACPEEMGHDGEPVFDFRRLSEHGVLWLVNRVVFHPRGFALSLVYSHEDDNTDPIGWRIEGDGSEVWAFDNEVDDAKYAEVEALLAQCREFGGAPHVVAGDE